MRKALWALAALTVAVMFAIVINPPKGVMKEQAEETAQQEKSAQAAREAILKEPKVELLVHEPEAGYWNVGVVDDGTSRVGYAGYICEVLQDHGAVSPRTQVRVVDAAKVRAGETYRAASLGRMKCASGDSFAR